MACFSKLSKSNYKTVVTDNEKTIHPLNEF